MTTAIQGILKNLKDPASGLGQQAEAALDKSRDKTAPLHDRLEQIDRLYDLIRTATNRNSGTPTLVWWMQICIAYRSSLFCWPLLTELGSGHGLSLPFHLFLDKGSTSPPGQEETSFTYLLSRTEKDSGKTTPEFIDCNDGRPAHIKGTHFGFTKEWRNSFAVGTMVAKRLWQEQNGQQDDDRPAGDGKRLHVDLRTACDIVHAVYSTVPNKRWSNCETPPFVVGDRSAEAYWAQCVLGLLLPAREVPLGVCTGTIEDTQDECELGTVAGIDAKLQYAIRAGISRVVIPGDRRTHHTENDNTLAAIEVNFARIASEAADAMQASGWHRATCLRTPGFRRTFNKTQRRLYLSKVKKDSLSESQAEWLDRNGTWHPREDHPLQRLDQRLLPASESTDSICYIEHQQLAGMVEHASIEEALGKWMAWKDHQLRSQGHARGLAVQTLRTSEGDNDTRLWAYLAEMLDATGHWWEQFHHADLKTSAELLAQLLCSREEDPKISLGAAPDLLVIFDDAGLTQKRRDTLFPNDFQHQFFDLLNPDRPEKYLDQSLKRLGHKKFVHPIRIIVLFHTQKSTCTWKDYAILERLAVFPLDFSKQAGFAMANCNQAQKPGVDWKEFEHSLRRLIDDGLVVGRHNLQLTPKAREWLKQREPQHDNAPFVGDSQALAKVHFHAALALCPILHPEGLAVSTGRDRQLEPENVLKADWHLQRAWSLIPTRFRSECLARWKKDGLPALGNARALLASLHTRQSWDTVYRLRVNLSTSWEAIELSDELLPQGEPSSLAVGWAIEAMGFAFRGGAHKTQQNQQEGLKDDVLAAKINTLVENAINHLKKQALDDTEKKRRLLHLYSRQLFALRTLGLSMKDPRLWEAKEYLYAAVGEILRPAFLKKIGENREGLDDVLPISKECWRTLWNDGDGDKTPNKTLDLLDQSSYAYAAARAGLGKTRDGQPSPPWDEPWIAYFALTRPELIAKAQIVEPLRIWWELYGQTRKDSLNFGNRVLGIKPHVRWKWEGVKKGTWNDQWLETIVQACRNLWDFITYPNTDYRLIGISVTPALRLLQMLAMQETLPAFSFLNAFRSYPWSLIIKHDQKDEDGQYSEKENWPFPASKAVNQEVEEEWMELARAVVGHRAGWVSMLASLNLEEENRSLPIVINWLTAYAKLKKPPLTHADPEHLLSRMLDIPSVEEYISALACARDAVEYILKLKDDTGKPALKNPSRQLLQQIRNYHLSN